MEKIFTSANFDAEVLNSSMPVLVDFFAVWCGPCKMMAPAIEKLAEEYEGKAVVGKLDVDESMDIAGRYGIMNIPTLIIFKNGEIVSKFVGLQNKNELKKALDAAL
ncbi:thioredoxin [Lachnospiraceae bacterium 45-P1]